MDSSEEKKKMNTSHDLFTRGESLLIFSECVLPARLEPKDIKILREKRRLPPTRSPVYEHICHMIWYEIYDMIIGTKELPERLSIRTHVWDAGSSGRPGRDLGRGCWWSLKDHYHRMRNLAGTVCPTPDQKVGEISHSWHLPEAARHLPRPPEHRGLPCWAPHTWGPSSSTLGTSGWVTRWGTSVIIWLLERPKLWASGLKWWAPRAWGFGTTWTVTRAYLWLSQQHSRRSLSSAEAPGVHNIKWHLRRPSACSAFGNTQKHTGQVAFAGKGNSRTGKDGSGPAQTVVSF